jgi:hypothetical protein
MVNNINQAAININRARIWIQRFYGLSDNEKRHLMANYSIPLDRHGLHDLRSDEAITKKVFRLIMISLIGVESIVVAAEFATDFEKFRTRPSANYDISGRPFSSLDDGTYRTGAPVTPTNPNGLLPADPRLAKVKTFLRRYVTREPTDKDIDWFVYTYFGSDAFGLGDMFYGMQDSYYNARGRKIRRNVPYDEPVQRNQRRIRSGVGYNRRTYRYHGRFNDDPVNSNNRPRHRNTPEYLRNEPAVKRNQNRNKSNNAKKIQWTENTVSNMPRDILSFENISNGEKVVKYSWKTDGETHSRYFQPQSFRKYARMSMTDAYNKPGSFSMFENPETRANVKRSNINFVILKKRVNKRKTNAATKIQKVVRGRHKRKTNAATKIQKVVRGTQARNKIRKNAQNAQNALNKLTVVQKSVLRKKTKQVKNRVSARRTLLANAASKRKRSPK